MGYNPINGESYATKDGLYSKVETSDNVKPADGESGHEPSSDNGHAQEPVAENGNGHASANGDEPVANGKVRSFDGSSGKQMLTLMFASRRRTQLFVLSIHQVADAMVLSGRDPSLGLAYHWKRRMISISIVKCKHDLKRNIRRWHVWRFTLSTSKLVQCRQCSFDRWGSLFQGRTFMTPPRNPPVYYNNSSYSQPSMVSRDGTLNNGGPAATANANNANAYLSDLHSHSVQSKFHMWALSSSSAKVLYPTGEHLIRRRLCQSRSTFDCAASVSLLAAQQYDGGGGARAWLISGSADPSAALDPFPVMVSNIDRPLGVTCFLVSSVCVRACW